MLIFVKNETLSNQTRLSLALTNCFVNLFVKQSFGSHPEEPPTQNTKTGSTDDIKRIMHAYINAAVSNQGCYQK